MLGVWPRDRNQIIAIKQSAITAAGNSPATNSAPIESVVTEANTSMAIDGGTVSPITAQADSTAAISLAL